MGRQDAENVWHARQNLYAGRLGKLERQVADMMRDGETEFTIDIFELAALIEFVREAADAED
jgi:hypothetical protein